MRARAYRAVAFRPSAIVSDLRSPTAASAALLLSCVWPPDGLASPHPKVDEASALNAMISGISVIIRRAFVSQVQPIRVAGTQPRSWGSRAVPYMGSNDCAARGTDSRAGVVHGTVPGLTDAALGE